jgi:D-alanine-D-alanine ligase
MVGRAHHQPAEREGAVRPLRREARRGDRLRVAVLMGGPSSEHEISLQSGRNVVEALDPRRFDVRPIVISREGRWRMPPRTWRRAGAFDPHDSEGWREARGLLQALEEIQDWRADVAVPVLHGRFGEDGTLQACLAAARIPFVGSGSRASALASDKIRTKEVLSFHGISTPDFEVLDAERLRANRSEAAERLVERFGVPLVLKDPRGGSSLEVRIVDDAGEAAVAIGQLAPPAEQVLAEAYVRGRELTAGVVHDRERGEPIALPIVEIRPRRGRFFDPFEKYDPEGAEELCPAPLPEAVEAEARALGLRLHRLLGLEGISRTDMILTADGRLEVLEVNTLPGMTEQSLLPRAARAMGLAFAALVENLVRTAAVR